MRCAVLRPAYGLPGDGKSYTLNHTFFHGVRPPYSHATRCPVELRFNLQTSAARASRLRVTRTHLGNAATTA
eukprot:548287-Rhodomonas_salina.2